MFIYKICYRMFDGNKTAVANGSGTGYLIYSVVRVTQIVCHFTFGNCIFCPSLDGFGLPVWYLLLIVS